MAEFLFSVLVIVAGTYVVRFIDYCYSRLSKK